MLKIVRVVENMVKLDFGSMGALEDSQEVVKYSIREIKERNPKNIKISYELLKLLLPLPEDATVEAVYVNQESQMLDLVVKSEMFEYVAEGAEMVTVVPVVVMEDGKLKEIIDI
jgi:hypothetical protein